MPPAWGTGTNICPCGLLAKLATFFSPDGRTSPPCCSPIKTVSPSGVKKTSPKISSKFKVAGVPRCATATDDEVDKPGTFEVNIGTLGKFDMVLLKERDGNREREHTRSHNIIELMDLVGRWLPAARVVDVVLY
jgi:hypothetical protein